MSYGFLGRKIRTESVTRETETDYWVLTTKKGSMKREGSGRERGGSLEEEDNRETIFCLASDGSLRKLRRTQQTVLWDNHRFEDLGWSGWSAENLKDLDHYMVDFDFHGSISAADPGCWRERTEVVGDMDFYLERGNDPFIRRVYPKGVGLYAALKGLMKAHQRLTSGPTWFRSSPRGCAQLTADLGCWGSVVGRGELALVVRAAVLQLGEDL